MGKIYLFYGPNGVRKTSAALSPGCRHAEFDAGSLERAWNERAKRPYRKEDLNSRSFYAPSTSLRDIGKLSTSMVGESGKGAIQVVHRYRGWRAKYIEFIDWFIDWIETGDDADFVIDTGSKLWVMARNALRERIQDEVPENQQGDRLKRLEYEEPSSQMHSLLEEAKARSLNLFIIAHEGEVWRNDKPTGEPKPDGWGESRDEADVVLRFARDNYKAYAVIEKCSGLESLLGMRLDMPTHDSIQDLLACAEKLLLAGKPIPSEPALVKVEAMKL